MASHNEYLGYVKLPKKKEYSARVRVDFNGHVFSKPEETKLEGFSLRLFTRGKNMKEWKEQPEIGVTLRPEEWLDLIDAMKEEFENSSRARKEFDDMGKDSGDRE
jgi:hypothetical protein